MIFKNFIYLFIIYLKPSWVLFSLVAESGAYFLVAVHGLFIVVASLVVEHGL